MARRVPILAVILLFATVFASNSSVGVAGAVGQPHQTGRGSPPPLSTLNAKGPLLNYGGPVEAGGTIENYVILWQPPGYNTSPNYYNQLLQFFSSVGGSSLLGVASQYWQGPVSSKTYVQNLASLAGFTIDTTQFPSGTLNDGDIQSAIARNENANGWTASPTSNFFVFLPNGEGMCSSIAGNTCYSQNWCGIHLNGSVNGYTTANYAVIGYVGTSTGCQQRKKKIPSSLDADASAAINVASHEFMEMVTDPMPVPGHTPVTGQDGWVNTSALEMGDLCAAKSSPTLNGGGDIVIGGQPYLLQPEWSNANKGCTLDAPLVVQFGAPITAGAGLPDTVQLGTFSDYDPNSTPSDFNVVVTWGDGSQAIGNVTSLGGGTFNLSAIHTWAAAGKFKVKVAIKDQGNASTPGGATAGYVATAKVITPGPNNVLVGTEGGIVDRFTQSGILIGQYDDGQANYVTGMCRDSSGNVYATNFGAYTISKFDSKMNLVTGAWATVTSGEVESCSIANSTGHLFAGAADTNQIFEFDLATGALVTSFTVTTGSRGTDWLDVLPDGCTIRYTSEDSVVRQFNACTDSELPNFTTSSAGPCYENHTMANGDVVAACTSEVDVWNPDGTLNQSYPGVGAFNVALTSDPSTLLVDSFTGSPPTVSTLSLTSGTSGLTYNVPGATEDNGLLQLP